jgi:glutamine amidotransferase
MTRVSIVDYSMGNIRSVANAFEAVGGAVEIVSDPGALATAERIVLPGVGAFGDGMRNLRDRGWDEALGEHVLRRGLPFLGLCVGMQVLADVGTEHGEHQGLGWIPGRVDRLAPSDPAFRVPHVGWNDVAFEREDGIHRGLGERADFYFVHSYAFRPDDPSVVAGVCDYGGPFAATISAGNVYATQFHPEKSQRAGLTILRNFLACRSTV